MPTATAASKAKAPKPVPVPNGDFYQLVDLLTPEDKAIVKKVRTYMETKVQPIINKYWSDDAFPFELLPSFKELGIGGPDLSRGLTAFGLIDAVVGIDHHRLPGDLSWAVSAAGPPPPRSPRADAD